MIYVPNIRDMDAISYLVLSHDAGYNITIYRYISCDITHTGSPRNTRHIQIERKLSSSLRSTLDFFGFVSALTLACLPSGLLGRPYVIRQLGT